MPVVPNRASAHRTADELSRDLVARGLQAARDAIETEAAAVSALADRLDGVFLEVLTAVARCEGHLVVTGLGKSGLVGRKIAATLASTGTPATFIHSADALHGDSGAVTPRDLVLALSASGETAEVCAFARMLRDRQIPVIAMTGREDSTLAQLATYTLDTMVLREADPLNLAPTASTTASLAMGDALACALVVLREFSHHDFAQFHPSGALGKRLSGDQP
ncbi:arabinose-5-phosphate isomerase [Kribbella sp. VKM Ac-2571]|uniref:KpsF/GutQ family sugar-phosphate isomerase n=1 Tax=Kribbella sp. VKM Ac-2571 TaxID=2512222 RepID=UPI0010F2D678|nr:SIS domain-containing protein [Kribbella sp. VKM Ac-2571]TDO68733.1 arabinose-5-phosphate isomerase [Kribbella sp. VKM Ac-2571]